MRTFVLSLLMVVSRLALAHPGPIDRDGCHVARSSGKEHCHPDRLLKKVRAEERLRAPKPTRSQAATEVQVKRVVDGDTLELVGGERVRLIGVNTPELNDPRQDVRSFSKEASLFVEDLVAGKSVALEFDGDRRDHYGRLLAYVYLADGRCVNSELIRQGYGYALTRFPFRYSRHFRTLEREAKAQRQGLWNEAWARR